MHRSSTLTVPAHSRKEASFISKFISYFLFNFWNFITIDGTQKEEDSFTEMFGMRLLHKR